MQGTAADIIKKAMVNVDQWLNTNKLDAHVIMQVHDELILEVADSCVDQVKAGVLHYMSNAAILDVPLIVDVGIGQNWDEAH